MIQMTEINCSSFNPLTYYEKLKKSGINEESAKEMAQEQAEIISTMINNDIATKQDVGGVFEYLSIIQNDVNSLESKMTIKFGVIMLAGVGLLTFLLKHT